MGWWWKKLDFPVSDKTGSLEGLSVRSGKEVGPDSTAWSKWMSILWRFQNKWVVFQVEGGMFYYWVCFQTDSVAMQYRRRIFTQYFAARVGRERTRFSAFDPRGNPLLLRQVTPVLLTRAEVKKRYKKITFV